MITDAILELLGGDAKVQAFKSCLHKLETAPPLNLEALAVCIRLRQSINSTATANFPDENAQPGNLLSASQSQGRYDLSKRVAERNTLDAGLCDLLLARIPQEQVDSNHFYKLAEILCSDASFAHLLFREKIYPALDALLPDLSDRSHGYTDAGHQPEDHMRQLVRVATSYLTLLKCSYWLPSDCNHVIDAGTLELLSRFVSLSATDELAYDAMSALFSLLRKDGPIVIAPTANDAETWLKLDPSTEQMVLSGSILDSSLWDQLSMINPRNPTTGKQTSRVFRTWFQWISQAVNDKKRLDCLHDDRYWDILRFGMLYGHGDQRKYCIGIVRQSLLAAQSDIDTSVMQFRIAERTAYLRIYEQYSALFETIVLDRYANQVQACLPELTKLLQTKITPLMISTLLSAALSPMIQDGVRKLVGNWYIEHVIKIKGNIDGHLPFLLDGFLPWATLGELFTNTLNVTRNTTISVHGASLADVIARFVQAAPVTAPPPSPAGSDSTIEPLSALHRRAVITGVMDFIIDAEGRIFQFSILYLLEGLVNGLRQCSEELPLQAPLTSADIDKISRVSRLPGLPEIAGDLYKDYCAQLCDLTSPGWADVDMPAYQQIRHAAQKLTTCVEPKTKAKDIEPMSKTGLALQALRDDLESSNHRCIQGEKYAPMCKDFIEALDQMNPASVNSSDLFIVLEAFWEEADRRQFIRPVAVHIPSLLFHPTCVRVCMLQQSESTDQTSDESLSALLTKALGRLQRLAEGRIYVLSTLATSIRRAVLACPDLISILQLEVYILHFVNNPPTIKSEFLFEVAAAEKLQQSQPHRSYKSYYGLREWHAYATMIDLLRRFPEEQISVAKRIFARLLEPWKNQRPGAPVVSKWKNVLQLQAMLLLVDFCVAEFEADVYLTYLRHALTLEAWPRYRFLLEWIIARVYYRFPNKASRILDDLSKLDENSSTHIASLMKLAVLVAPREAEDFSATFMTQLVSFSASPKVQIRHESNYAIPIIYDLATSSGWTNITANPAFRGLDTFVRSLAKFQSTPWTIRTLKLEAVSDYTLMEIFGGQYLTIESPEKERVAYEDFIALHEADRMSDLTVPPERVPLGELRASKDLVEDESLRNIRQKVVGPPSSALPAFFQTKSGFDINSLHPQSAPPSVQNQRPASVILVASLIDNPTNIGGLSRLSESFGLEALYIADLRQTAHKDFKATSVTSEKHFPIHELKVAGVPDFLIAMKTNGYVAVGIEQTDQSAILGSEDIRNTNHMSLGTLPRKCVLVLGSEKGGISAEVLAALDRCVEIRTVGVTRSLNVQTAGGIALYEWWRKWYGKI